MLITKGNRMKNFIIATILLIISVSIANAKPHKKPECFLFFCNNTVVAAQNYVGDHLGMTGRQLGMRHRRWCAEYHHLKHGGRYRGVADDRAISWRNAGSPAAYGCIGCTAVMPHHVGTVQGYDEKGNVILHSGNHGGRVGVGTYHRSRFVAFRHT